MSLNYTLGFTSGDVKEHPLQKESRKIGGLCGLGVNGVGELDALGSGRLNAAHQNDGSARLDRPICLFSRFGP